MQKAQSNFHHLLFLILLLLMGHATRAQQCTGSFGDPVINITFGSGANPGPALKAAATGYTYTTTTCPADGYYTVVNSTTDCFGSTWHNVTSDHTGNARGYFMLINASYTPSDFYLDTVKGLCASTTYRFGAWIANMLVPSACSGAGIQPNITFSIESTSGTKLATFNTGNISSTSSLSWKQYSLDFTVPVGITDIVLRMTNNSAGGCGNDLALDDITFSPCGPKAEAGIASSNGSNTVSFCIDAQTSLLFSGAVSPGYGTPNYQWQVSTDTGATWTDIPGATTVNYTRPVSAAPGLYEYRMAVGDGANVYLPTCRVASNIISVTVWPIPIPAAVNNGPVCQGDTARFVASDGVTYNWTGPNGFSASGQSISILRVLPSAAGTYTVTVTNGGGCTRSGQTTLAVYASPSPAFTSSGPSCEQTQLTFIDQSTATAQTIRKWSWTFGDNAIDSVQSPSHTYASPGDYTVGLIVTTDKGCSNTIYSQVVRVHHKPVAWFGMPEVCLADPASYFQFTDSSSIADGTQTSFTYAWSFDDPAAGPASPNTSTQKNPIHSYTSAGPFSVQLTVTSGDGCTDDTTRAFSVNGSNPQAAFDLAPATLCSNQPVLLTDRSSVSPGNIIKTQVYWDYRHDPTIQTTDDAPADGKIYGHGYPDFSTPSTQTYELRYIVYSGQTCLNQKTIAIVVNASPDAIFNPLDPVCEEISPYQITAGAETRGFSGVGAYSGRGINAGGTFTPRLAGPGLDTLVYTFTAGNGCYDTAKRTILVYPQPHAEAGPSEYFLEGGVLYLQGSGSGNDINYSWSPADSILGDPHTSNPKVSPHEDITYTLTVTSADGCTASDSVQIFVLKIPVVPNAFSPNGDGINDTWIIRYLDEYPGAEIEVFNRYGQPVFHVIGYSRPWDGTYNGNPLPIGTYYWVIDPKNGRKRISGSVTIIR